ncbi:MAG: HNH endonuclease [Pelolinea sp.]|nr:HNH endonuclease [Pelolinea sp.]
MHSEPVLATDVDHKVPLSSGGTHADTNLEGMCHSCHSRKTALNDGGFGNQKIDHQRGGA